MGKKLGTIPILLTYPFVPEGAGKIGYNPIIIYFHLLVYEAINIYQY